MFQIVKAKVVYKLIDGKDASKSFEPERVGLNQISGVFCELMNYFTIRSDNGIFFKATLDVCEKEFDSLGLGTYLSFTDWDEDNLVMFSDFSTGGAPLSFPVGNTRAPAALVFLPKLKKGVIMFMENSSADFDVYFDHSIEGNSAKVGVHVIHSGKVLRRADRVALNHLIYTFDADGMDDIKSFYVVKVKKVINVNPHDYDFRILQSDSLIKAMGGNLK